VFAKKDFKVNFERRGFVEKRENQSIDLPKPTARCREWGLKEN